MTHVAIALAATCGLAIAACSSKPAASYRPETTEQFTLTLFTEAGFPTAIMEVAVPKGYQRSKAYGGDQSFDWTRGEHDVRIVVSRAAPRAPDWDSYEKDLCGPAPYPRDTDRPVHSASSYVRGSDGSELALCTREQHQTHGRRGASRYWVRKRIPVEDNVVECVAEMRGVRNANPTGASSYVDASKWTATQRAELLDVCRSLRVITVEPPREHGHDDDNQPADTDALP